MGDFIIWLFISFFGIIIIAILIIVLATKKKKISVVSTSPITPTPKTKKWGLWDYLWRIVATIVVIVLVIFFFASNFSGCGKEKEKGGNDNPPPAYNPPSETTFPKSGYETLYAGQTLQAYINHNSSYVRIIGLGKNSGFGSTKFTYVNNSNQWFIERQSKPTPEWGNSSVGNYNITTDQDSVLVHWW